MSDDGVVVIKAQRHRSQELNRRDALERLKELVARAAEVPRARKPTRPTYASKQRRLEGKSGAPRSRRGAPRSSTDGRVDNPAMAKEKSIYTCTECGGTSPKWLGKCPSCGAWNTLVESVAEGAAKNRFASPSRGLTPAEAVATLAEIDATDAERQPTGIDELDRVLGGGIVAGGVVLIGGDPGIGKSTLLLQALDALSRADEGALRHRRGERRAGRAALAPARPRRERGARAGRDPAREDPGDDRGRAAGGLRRSIRSRPSTARR